MANETEFANITQATDYLAAGIAPHFRDQSFMSELITLEEAQKGSNTAKFTKQGSFTAAVVNESADASKSEYTETASSAVLAKVMVYTNPSIEAVEWSKISVMDRLMQEAVAAIRTKFDTDAIGLFSGFSSSVGTSGSDLTLAQFENACYTNELNNNPEQLTAVLHPIQVSDLRVALGASSAAIFGKDGRENLMSLGMKRAYKGTLYDVPVFGSSLCPTANAGADRVGAVFSKFAIAGIWNPQVKVLTTPKPINGTYELSVIMFYGLIEWKDEAGCKVVTDA